MILTITMQAQGMVVLKARDKTKSRRNKIMRKKAGSFSSLHFVFQPEPDMPFEKDLRPLSKEVDS